MLNMFVPCLSRFESRVDRRTRESKLISLVDSRDELMDDMSHQHSLSQHHITAAAVRLWPIVRYSSMFLAFVLNFIVLLGYGVKTPVSNCDMCVVTALPNQLCAHVVVNISMLLF